MPSPPRLRGRLITPSLSVRRTALVLVVGLALGGCRHTPASPRLVTGPTPDQVRAFCGAAKAPAPMTAEGYRLLTVDLAVASQQPVVPTPQQARFSQASNAFRNAAEQEKTYLQGQTHARSKPALDRAFQDAQRAMLSACHALPATLLAGTPLPLPSTLASLDEYCAVADLPVGTPAELAALQAAAGVTAPFSNTPRNRAIGNALMVLSAAAAHAAFEAKLSPELRNLDASLPTSKEPLQNLPLAIANLRDACR